MLDMKCAACSAVDPAAEGPTCVPRVAQASLLGAHSLPRGRNLIGEDTGGGRWSEGLGSSELSLFGQDRMASL